jgi:HEAT repeat protein
MQRLTLIAASLFALAIFGCSKSTPPTEAPAPAPAKSVAVSAPTPARTETSSPVSDKEAASLEARYRGATDSQVKLDAIFQLTRLGTAEAVETIGRLFEAEGDLQMKVDLVDSLTSFEGQHDRKLSILASASQAGQPEEVREAAVEGLMSLNDRRAIPLLQPMLQDKNSDIAAKAKEAIDVLKWEPVTP